MISLMTSGGVALGVAVLSTPVLIRWLIKNNIGQQIREDGPQVHIAKAGTPTMGGIGIVAAVVIGYLTAHLIPGVHFSPSGTLIMILRLVIWESAVAAWPAPILATSRSASRSRADRIRWSAIESST